MGQTRIHPPVKLIIGFIFKDESVLEKVEKILIRHFGKIDFNSPALEFKYTGYYQEELGLRLKRKFISFAKPINPTALAKIKTITNAIEIKLSKDGKRKINIDPGYLDLAKLILATTKDYVHRIYLNQGIYAEITLFYRDGTFRPSEWTYPDYRTAEYIEIFNRIRDIYREQIK